MTDSLDEKRESPGDSNAPERDVIDMLMSVGAYLKSKGLRKVELTIDNHSRLRIEIDVDWVSEIHDQFVRTARGEE